MTVKMEQERRRRSRGSGRGTGSEIGELMKEWEVRQRSGVLIARGK